jgi:hypothetical protein
MKKYFFAIAVATILFSCKKNSTSPPVPETFNLTALRINGNTSALQYNINYNPLIKLAFSAPVNKNSVAANISLKDNSANAVAVNYSYENNDSIIVLQPFNR